MQPHPHANRIARAMERCLPLAQPWSGDWYRFTAPRWAGLPHLLTGQGALLAGGRWHPPGACRSVYASLDPETALAEALAHHRRFHVSVREAMPKTLNAVAVDLYGVLDLTTGRLRQRLGLSWQRMRTEPWWKRNDQDDEAVTQAVGRLAWEMGLEALLVPSATRKQGKNMVYFPDNRHPKSRLEIIHPEDVPVWPSD